MSDGDARAARPTHSSRPTTTIAPTLTRDSIEEMMKRTGLKLDVSASAVESDGPVGKAAKMQEQLFLQAVSECDEFPSFTKRSHPCWVMSLTQLRAFNELPQHEGTGVLFNPNSLITVGSS